MAKRFSRQTEVERIRYFPGHAGSRAVFLAEARTRKEARQIRELFDMVGQLAEVVPISHGAVMSYAVQVQEDTSLFGKIEWLLKSQFTFSLVERNFSDVTFHLVRSLCEDSDTELVELPQCGVCAAIDPFPTRATVELRGSEEPRHLAYCVRCTARFAEEDETATVRSLIARDQRRLRVARDATVLLMPEIVDEKPDFTAARLAIAG